MTTDKLKAAIIGSGNIGTDLMIKIMRHSKYLEIAAMVGIDAASDGLARAARLGVATTHEGVQGLVRLPVFDDIEFVFDATSAGAHVKNDAFLRALKPGIRLIDLTPAAIGPYCVPVVNHDVAATLVRALTDSHPLSPRGVKEALERVKMMPAASGAPGTRVSLGKWTRRAWMGSGYLVARTLDADGVNSHLVDRFGAEGPA